MSEMPSRIQLRRTKGWRMPENTVKVDRSSEFGSPFPIAKGTSTKAGIASPIWVVGTWEGPAMWFANSATEAREISVNAFRAWASAPAQQPLIGRARLALRGKNLACWCPLPESGEPDCCHAAVLLKIANAAPLPAPADEVTG